MSLGGSFCFRPCSFQLLCKDPQPLQNYLLCAQSWKKKNWFFLEITRQTQKCTWPDRQAGDSLCLPQTPPCLGLPGVRRGIMLRPRPVGRVPHGAGNGRMAGPGQLFLQTALLKVHFSFMPRSPHLLGVTGPSGILHLGASLSHLCCHQSDGCHLCFLRSC